MSETMQDKRHDPRVPLIAAVDITEVATGTRLSARTSDLSRTGCYIDTLNPTPVKALVTVRLTYSGEELELPGRIVYVSHGLGMGVRFDENLTSAQITVLDRWIASAR